MAATCRICGQTIDTEEALDGTPEHAACRDPRPTYENDLRYLVELAGRRAEPEVASEDVALTAPPSVREAIRLCEGLLPPPAPAAVAPSPEPAPIAPTRKRSIKALPVIVLVLVGAVLGTLRASHRASGAAAPPVADMKERLGPPAPTSALAPESAPAQPSVPDPVVRAPAPPPPPATQAPPPVHPRARRIAAPTQRPPAAASAPPDPPAAPPEPPSLMQAITDAVRGPRGAPPSPPPAAQP